jgi:3-hydroxyacyl-CoA dehydrogenase, NAD binding domain
MVIEAVPERLDLKREVFGDLDRLADPDAVLGSNASSLPSSSFIDDVDHVERAAGGRGSKVAAVQVGGSGPVPADGPGRADVVLDSDPRDVTEHMPASASSPGRFDQAESHDLG